MIVNQQVEDKVLASLGRVRDFAMVASQYVKPAFFEGAVKHNLAKMFIDYYQKYQIPMTSTVFINETKKLVQNKTIVLADVSLYSVEYRRLLTLNISDWEYVLDELITFVKNREIRSLIEQSVKDLLPKNNFLKIESEMARIASISTMKDVKPMEYYNDVEIEKRTDIRLEEKEQRDLGIGSIGISSGIAKVDDILPKRGWWQKELTIFMAPAKRGKSMALLFFANMAVHQGENVAYFTCENSKEVCADRLDAQNTGIETKTLYSNAKQIKKIMQAKKPKGRLFIFEYPTKRLTVDMANKKISDVEREFGIRITMGVFDYGDIMKARRSYDDPLREQASIFEDLRTLAGDRAIPVLSATQVNRSGTNKALISGVDVAGTYEKIMVADYIISFSASDDDLKKEVLMFHFAECRNVEKKTLKISTKYSTGLFYKDFIELVA